MRDRREELLVRTLALMSGLVLVPALVETVRNTADLGDARRPAIVVLDGDETSIKRVEGRTQGLRLPPQLVAMTPQIFYLAGDLPENMTIGTHLNTAKVAILNAIWHDAALRAICGSNGGIYYGGCETDLKTGSTISGELQVNPVFVYPLLASELTATGV
jgi:hypothetical protein